MKDNGAHGYTEAANYTTEEHLNIMKEVRANCYVEVLCTCPNCGYGLDIIDEVREVMDDDHRASGIDVEVTCEDCKEKFLVTDVDF